MWFGGGPGVSAVINKKFRLVATYRAALLASKGGEGSRFGAIGRERRSISANWS